MLAKVTNSVSLKKRGDRPEMIYRCYTSMPDWKKTKKKQNQKQKQKQTKKHCHKMPLCN